MKKFNSLLLISTVLMGLTACDSMIPGTQRVAGGLGGATVGGILGNSIGGGTGRTVATIAGAGLGALTGSHLAGSRNTNNVQRYHRANDGRVYRVR